ncbi:MAG TPA: 1-acyl-sn-glycerol-3-phosphate acyltransferase [Lutibacter sp.]|nr:1-acyl-sn-glycerol-3-phosphate acyltransferase [Lutibacter sp.]
MKLIRYFFILLWRVWLYLIVVLSIIPMLPILVVVTAKEKHYPKFYKIAHQWGKLILFLMGFKAEVEYEEKLVKGKSYMLSANHTSLIDIMLMLAIVDENPFVFVGKAELAKLPVLGFVYKRTMILVDRGNANSRRAVFEQANQRIKSGRSVCIFPEGEVPKDESLVLTNFKNGAFILAIEHQIPIVPISFYDNKKRFSYTFFSGSPGKLRVKFHKPISTLNMTVAEDKNKLKKKVYDLLYKDLEGKV